MTNSVRVTELDFDTIKTNIKEYLRNQSQFTDFDFEASNLSVLLDILAYNTHYNAVLANMVSNEMFIDTALKRSSVVSLAKQVSYVPRSRRSATALVNVALQNISGSPNFITLNPYTLFTTFIEGTAYNFYNIASYTTTPVNGVYNFSNVKLYQGRKLEYYFTVAANPGPAKKYEIPSTNIDTTTLSVAIQYGGVGSFSDTYTQVTDITEVTATSKVFFLQENTRGYYEIYFGDDVIGANLTAGDIIKVSYVITDGDAANVSTNVSLSWSCNAIAGETSNDRTITTVSKPSGGAERENTDSIRFTSTNNYTAQGRAVTLTDYSNLIYDSLPGAQSVNVWGGEDNVPPIYGKTFISIKPRTGYTFTDVEKARIVNDVLKPRSIITSQHEFVDPTLTYVKFNVKVRYSSARTNLSADGIRSLIYTKIQTFMNTNLEKFNAAFYRSQLEEQLMDVDDSIISVNVQFGVQKRLPVQPGVRFSNINSIQLPIKVHPNELRSSYFYFTDDTGTHPSQIRDVPDESPPDYEGTGTIKTFDLDTGAILDPFLASINYGTGLITVNAESPLTLNGYLGNATQLYINAGSQESTGDIFPGYNEILVLDDSIADTVANVENGISIDVIAVNN